MSFLFNKKIDTTIEVLDLSKKSLKTVPEYILQYSNLKELDLSKNQLTELPVFLKELKFLKKINLHGNELTELPSFIFNYDYLVDIDVSSNKISEIPLTNNYYDFSRLEILDIGYNPLKKIPAWIWKLSSIQELFISGLEINELPIEIGNLKTLTTLSISESNLDDFPESIGYLKNLSELWADDNNLSTLPNTFKNLQKLRDISFSSNNFKILPKVITELKNLQRLDVVNNGLQELPNSIENLENLDYLDLMSNDIKNFPASFYTMNFELLDVCFDDNPFSEETKIKIFKQFPEVDESSLVIDELTTEERIESFSHINPQTKESTESDVLDIKKLWYVAIPIVLWLFYVINPFKKDSEEAYYEEQKKQEEAYLSIKKREAQEVQNILGRLREVQIYTNDTVKLELNLDPNRAFNDRVYARIMKDKYHRFINNTFENRSYGYTVKLYNQREELNQMQVYDSVMPLDSIKKFKLTGYYKLESREKKWYKKVVEIRDIYDEKERKDTVFGVFETVVRLDELTKGAFNEKLKFFHTPLPIKLNREAFYFYFSPLNENISESEFLEATEKFNKMFIKKGDPNKQCKIQKVRVRK